MLCVEQGRRFCCVHLLKIGGLLKIMYSACIITYCISLLLYSVTGSSSTAGVCRGTVMGKETSELVPGHSPGTQEARALVWARECCCLLVPPWHIA